MGIAERKEREAQEMRTKIINAAMQMFVDKGFEETSIRQIAKSIEYSPAALYRYFANKDELFYAVHACVFDLLYDHLKTVQNIEHPVHRLIEMGRMYLDFALKNQEYYELLFVQKSPMQTEITEDEWSCVMNTFGLLQNTVKDCIEQGYFSNTDLHTTTLICWSNMHGMITLYFRDRMKMYPEEHRLKLIHQSVAMMIDLLQK
ncbi:MAG: TetR/AcrR family transcriptional regulator [Bacteroidota bacterium]